MPESSPSSEKFVLPTGASIAEISRYETKLVIDEIFARRVYPLPDLSGVEAPVIVDIGANIGIFAHFAKEICPTSKIFSVEPVPPIAAILRSNVAELADVKVVECGIAAEAGEMEVTFYPGYSIMSRLNANSQIDEQLLSNCIRQDLQAKMTSGKGVDDAGVKFVL